MIEILFICMLIFSYENGFTLIYFIYQQDAIAFGINLLLVVPKSEIWSKIEFKLTDKQFLSSYFVFIPIKLQQLSKEKLDGMRCIFVSIIPC